jgi:two-component system, NtrC family, sensor kinase
VKYCLKILPLLLLPAFGIAQQDNPDSMRLALQKAPNDSVKYYCNGSLLGYYLELNRDSTLRYVDEMLLLAQKNKQIYAEARCLGVKGYELAMKGRYGESLQCFLLAFDIMDKTHNEDSSWFYSPSGVTPQNYKLYTLSSIQICYSDLMHETKDTEQENIMINESMINAKVSNDPYRLVNAFMYQGLMNLELNKLDSALICEKEALQFLAQSRNKSFSGAILNWIGEIYLKKGDKPLAKEYYNQGMQSALRDNNLSALSHSEYALSKYYMAERNMDSSLRYARKALQTQLSIASQARDYTIGDVYENLFLCYKLLKKFDSAYKYQGLTLIAKDSINQAKIKSLAEFQNLEFREQLRLQEVEKQRVAYQVKIRTYLLLAGIIVFIVITFLLYTNNRNRKKANALLLRQKEEIGRQKQNVEEALTELKTTQAQLIQSEKMASLGELTAGIAHEIQNPLNFMNNFSEVNKELIEEMKQELIEGNVPAATAIANNIQQNEDKINHHGKRADAIVKGMLQHSQSSTGKKEPTDINALADEYLRLAYHGYRAREKSFNTVMKTNYDESIGKINIIPQDMGRVLLNLYNNAFYAVSDRKKQLPEGYEPAVSVNTKKINGKIEIRIMDNGNGIPQKVVDKIFQPFFTTKPTGQGTGLGLSMSYDIIKAHGGEIKVDTKEGEGTEFIIQLNSIY